MIATQKITTYSQIRERAARRKRNFQRAMKLTATVCAFLFLGVTGGMDQGTIGTGQGLAWSLALTAGFITSAALGGIIE